MSKFKLSQTATEVQDILNNSLQKPTGLTKTKLVGVGVNGQENIEIGDNLTLANGKLSATGSLPSTVKFDEEGNRTVGKDLGVDGKLKLKSLVSASNPDGDITNKLNSIGWYQHFLQFDFSNGTIWVNYYNNSSDAITLGTMDIFFKNKFLSCSGFIKKNDEYLEIYYLSKTVNGFIIGYNGKTIGVNTSRISIDRVYDIVEKII